MKLSIFVTHAISFMMGVAFAIVSEKPLPPDPVPPAPVPCNQLPTGCVEH